MDNLVAFGCSLTYGHGLPDCLFDAAENMLPPSELAWPKLLADSLNLNCVNRGIPGASNLEILNRILRYNFSPTDTVFVLWSYTWRDSIFHEDRVEQIGLWQNTKLAKKWTQIHNEYDLTVRSWIYIHHAYQHLKSLNLKFYFLDVDLSIIEESWTKDIIFLKSKIEQRPLAPDGAHPGVECHRRFVENILKEISQNS